MHVALSRRVGGEQVCESCRSRSRGRRPLGWLSRHWVATSRDWEQPGVNVSILVMCFGRSLVNTLFLVLSSPFSLVPGASRGVSHLSEWCDGKPVSPPTACSCQPRGVAPAIPPVCPACAFRAALHLFLDRTLGSGHKLPMMQGLEPGSMAPKWIVFPIAHSL